MKTIRIVYLLFFTFFILSSAHANSIRIDYSISKDSVPALENDVSSIDGIIAALYDVISGPSGERRNWDRMRTLFITEAKMMSTGKRPDGSVSKRVRSVEEYISSSGPLLEKDGFFEREIGRTMERYGGIVQVFSSYASKRKVTDETPFSRGINSIQLWNDGKRWWIVSVLWQSETPDNPIPSKFLN